MLVAGLSSVVSFSCSDDDGATPSPEGKTAKFTITVDGQIDDSDYISFVIVGGTHDASEATVWKLNGQQLANQAGIGLDDGDFSGATKTYVIESIKPLLVAKAGAQVINFDHPLHVTFKAEIDGRVENEDDVTLTGEDDYTVDYTY